MSDLTADTALVLVDWHGAGDISAFFAPTLAVCWRMIEQQGGVQAKVAPQGTWSGPADGMPASNDALYQAVQAGVFQLDATLDPLAAIQAFIDACSDSPGRSDQPSDLVDACLFSNPDNAPVYCINVWQDELAVLADGKAVNDVSSTLTDAVSWHKTATVKSKGKSLGSKKAPAGSGNPSKELAGPGLWPMVLALGIAGAIAMYAKKRRRTA